MRGGGGEGGREVVGVGPRTRAGRREANNCSGCRKIFDKDKSFGEQTWK